MPRIASTLCLLTLLSLGSLAPAQTPFDVYWDTYQLRILELQMTPSAWNTVVNDQSLSIEVPAQFGEYGAASTILVAVRRKSGTALGQKVSLKIDINEYVAGQSWNGMKKLSLENGDDEDVLTEGLAWWQHRLAAIHMGTPYPYLPGIAAWTALVVNGQYMGLYLNVEQPDKSFLQNRGLYTQGSSWLYKVSDINSPDLKVGSGDSPAQLALCYPPFVGGPNGNGGGGGNSGTACPSPADPFLFANDLNTHIDMPVMLTYGAVSAFNGGGDQLFTHGKNFYYADRVGFPRMYLPWDLDSTLSGNTNASIFGTATPYQTLILDNPVFRPQYKAIMQSLINGPLSAANQIAYLTGLEQTLIPVALSIDPNNNLGGSDPWAKINALKAWVTQRVAAIQAELSGC